MKQNVWNAHWITLGGAWSCCVWSEGDGTIMSMSFAWGGGRGRALTFVTTTCHWQEDRVIFDATMLNESFKKRDMYFYIIENLNVENCIN